MTEISFFQILVFLLVLIMLMKPLGLYMAHVYTGKSCGLDRCLGFLEHGLYRLCGVDPTEEMDWKTYLYAMLLLNLAGLLLVYLMARLQFYLPLNPQQFAGLSPVLAFNTAISFATNTNWQAYAGESSLSYLTQMSALAVQNFLSAATGMSLVVAMIRGLVRHERDTLGNFWADMTRSILYILLPLASILAIALVACGVIQNFKSPELAQLIQPISWSESSVSKSASQQIIPMGPVASQVAIKQLGTNGGGFFNANSAHPFENPTPLSNFLEMLSILLIPGALCFTFGSMVKDQRQGLALLVAMLVVFAPFTMLTTMVEQVGNPAFNQMGVETLNMEGKEARFGIVASSIWTTATTAASNGSVNSMLDAYMPLSGLVPLWMMHLNEVIFGGVGSGLYGMIMFVIMAVFITGLMVGRTPEYLGKKIEPFEMKMASFATLMMPLIVLLFTAVAAVTEMGTAAVGNPGPHGFSEILYTFTSMANNNGSAFSGLNADTPFYNILGGIAMLLGRYWIAIPALAIAGSLASKKVIPSGLGTLPTHSGLFIGLLVCVIVIFSALSFLPALALGPIVEHLLLWGQYGH